jgi:hypothetical protein
MAIRKNLVITVEDMSESDVSIAFNPGVHFRTTDDGNVLIEALAQKVAISLTDLDDALNELQEFYGSNPVSKEVENDDTDNSGAIDLAPDPMIEVAKQTLAIAKEASKPKTLKKPPKPKLMHNIEYKEPEDPSLVVE